MFSAILTFAAEVAGAEETNHTAFYVCGGLLAAWAVLLAFVGMTRHDDFPGENGGRVIVAITAVLVVLAATTSITTA